jgi:hemerythrin-like metal-binding protein
MTNRSRFIVWEDEYAVGHSELDAHHRRMFEIINALYEAATTGIAEEQIRQTFLDMHQYTQIHFRAEENVLSAVRYPRLSDQKRAHGAFVGKLDELSRISLIPSQALSLDVLQFLKNWWLNHILEMDKDYAAHLSR